MIKPKKITTSVTLLILIFSILIPISSQAITNNQIKATVQIVCKDTYSGNWYSGSGTIIDPSGIVLTNRHVIMGGGNTPIKNCLVGFIDNPNQEPDFSYIAETKYYTTTSDKDAAILYIDNKTNKIFPFVDIFNSDSAFLHFGDKIEVVGYPSIGGSTLTYTDGTFSGIGSVRDGTHNYIKTTAILGHGNSGGSAYSNGKFIGIPTMVVSDIGITNSIGYILSVNSIKAWLSGVLGSSYQNKIIKYEPDIKEKPIVTPDTITPPDISKLSVSTGKDPSDISGKTIPFYFSHEDIVGGYIDDTWYYDPFKNSKIAGFYVYFGENLSADPVIDGIFKDLREDVRFPTPKKDGIYYLVMRLKGVNGSTSDKAVYSITYDNSFKCPLVTSISNANTGEKFNLRCEGERYCKPIVPGGVPLKIEWREESINSGFVNYKIGWQATDHNGIFSDKNASHSDKEIRECNKWGGIQTENVFNSPPLRYRWQYYATLFIQYTGNINKGCSLIEINTLPEEADYQKYLLPAENKNMDLKPDGTLVKTANSMGVYLIENGKRRPIKSAEIFLARGYKWGDVVEISQTEMNSYPLGTDLIIDENNENKETPSKQKSVGTLSNGALVRVKGTHGVYLIHNNQKRPIKSAGIFLGRGYKWKDVVDVDKSALDVYPTGDDIALLEDIIIEDETQTITINVPTLRVRSLPSINGGIISTVSEGKDFSVIDEQAGWYKINYEGIKTGWVMSKYTK